MNLLKINGETFHNMLVNASNSLEEQKEFVNSLNVFPVPDGDTGTNMSMTLKGAVEEIRDMKAEGVGAISKALAKGALMGARGNSGVILSQILRGMARSLEGKVEINAEEFADSLMEGSKSAYKAVMRPTEGTILTITRAAGDSAKKSEQQDIVKLMEEVCEHSRNVLNRTPEMLPVLKKAKVVDSGGMGYLVVLNGMLDALKGNMKAEVKDVSPSSLDNNAAKALNLEEIKFGYCTEFIILSAECNSETFRNEIEELGDSLIVVGYDDVIKTHIHTNDPGMVLSKAVTHGELSKIKIENMREQHRHLLVDDKSVASAKEAEIEEQYHDEETKKYGIVSVAMGEGIFNILKDLGVDKVIEGGQTMNPSTQDILEAVNEVNAETVFVLPNNKNIVMAANQAVELTEKEIVVIPSKSIPQGITALTAFNTDLDTETNKNSMIDALGTVNTLQVTYAVRDTEAEGKQIKEGDILGIAEGKITEVGTDLYDVTEKLIEDCINEDSELITVIYGKDCNETDVENFNKKLEGKYKDIDVQFYNGGQPLYYFIASIE
ncbi:DAK2 domain-containing protein [Clostridium oryzae]|uniref:Dihydroxyacetone kinase subunit DhaL n=1 Tax=Clostridium oryzae TaxID=1450648 RepID=A0A1V4IPP4_9CLOT|nr:DAK2 domain-containing protein [Clostridium oryzae]OPJ61765.1 dihydroxyacetone kinase subunit DhaL [Clostridium oryzae]